VLTQTCNAKEARRTPKSTALVLLFVFSACAVPPVVSAQYVDPEDRDKLKKLTEAIGRETAPTRLAGLYFQRAEIKKYGLGANPEPDYTKAIDLAPRNRGYLLGRSRYWLARSREVMSAKDALRAMADCKKALELDRENGDGQQQMASILECLAEIALNEGRYAKAEQAYTRSLQIPKRGASGEDFRYSGRGHARLLRGKLVAAHSDFEEAAKRDKRHWPNLGRARILVKQKAREVFEGAYGNEYYPFKGKAYTALWLATLKTTDADRTRLREHEAGDKWVSKLVAYWLGNRSAESLLAEARSAKKEDERAEHLCEAYVFLARKAELAGDTAAAIQHYRACAETKVHASPEFAFAVARLPSLGAVAKTPSPPAPPESTEDRCTVCMQSHHKTFERAALNINTGHEWPDHFDPAFQSERHADVEDLIAKAGRKPAQSPAELERRAPAGAAEVSGTEPNATAETEEAGPVPFVERLPGFALALGLLVGVVYVLRAAYRGVSSAGSATPTRTVAVRTEPILCPVCDETFTSYRALRFHENREHATAEPSPAPVAAPAPKPAPVSDAVPPPAAPFRFEQTVRLSSGEVLKGVVTDTGDSYAVKTKFGEMTVPKADVAEIEADQTERTLRLSSGEVLKGVVTDNGDSYVVKTKFGEMTVPKADVAAVTP
jgi:tetratricopeptide (TPR) repeat protein